MGLFVVLPAGRSGRPRCGLLRVGRLARRRRGRSSARRRCSTRPRPGAGRGTPRRGRRCRRPGPRRPARRPRAAPRCGSASWLSVSLMSCSFSWLRRPGGHQRPTRGVRAETNLPTGGPPARSPAPAGGGPAVWDTPTCGAAADRDRPRRPTQPEPDRAEDAPRKGHPHQSPWSPWSARPPAASPTWPSPWRSGSAARWSTPTRCSSTAAWTSARPSCPCPSAGASRTTSSTSWTSARRPASRRTSGRPARTWPRSGRADACRCWSAAPASTCAPPLDRLEIPPTDPAVRAALQQELERPGRRPCCASGWPRWTRRPRAPSRPTTAGGSCGRWR